MRKTVFQLVAAITGMAAILAAAASVQAVTLNEVLQDVVTTNPRILEKQKAYNAALAEMQEVRGGYFPKVIFTGNVGYKDYRDSETGYTNDNDGFYDARLTVSQLLHDFGKTSSLAEARKNYMLAALYAYVGEAGKVTYETAAAWLNVLKYNELLHLAMENVLTHEKLRESIKKQVKAGKKGRSELERVNGRMASAQSRLILRRNDYKKAEYNLHKLLGRFVATKEMVAPGMEVKALPGSLKEALDLQAKFNPQLREAFYSLAQKKSEYRNRKKAALGRLSLEGSASIENEFDKSDEYETEAKIGLRYTHTLFDASRSHKTRAAASHLHEEQQKSLLVRRTLLNDIQLCWAAHKLLTEQIGVLKKNLYFTQQALASYKKEFLLGRRNLINILDAQNENQHVNEQLINAVYARELEKYKVLQSEGLLLAKLGLLNPAAKAMMEGDKDYKPLSPDDLPLSLDMDGDGVTDDADVSMNSLPTDRVNKLGISTDHDTGYIHETVVHDREEAEILIKKTDSLAKKPLRLNVTTRFDFDVFLPEGTALTHTMTDKMMKEMVKQSRAYSTQTPLYITVSTNEYDDPDANYILALERAYTLKQTLLQNRIEDKAVFVFADTNVSKGHNTLRIKFTDKMDDYQKQYLTHSLTANVFVKGKTKIKDFKKLDAMLTKVHQNHGKAEIILYSNELSNMEASRQLGIKRAEVLRKYLAKKGIPANKVLMFSWGGFQEDPILPESWKVDQFFQYVLRKK